MKEDLAWLFAPVEKPPVLRRLPLLWPKGDAFAVRVLLDRGQTAGNQQYEWEDGGPMNRNDFDKVARMVAERVAG